jgi:hypothetical protein
VLTVLVPFDLLPLLASRAFATYVQKHEKQAQIKKYKQATDNEIEVLL